MACLRTQSVRRKMDEERGKTETIVLSSSEEENYDDDSEQQFSDCDEPSDSESDDTDIDDEEEEDDRDEPTGSDDCDVDDESLSAKVVSLLQDGNVIDSLKLNECKAYLRKHGLRLAGNRAVCIARIKEHWRLRHESGYSLYPRSSFNINCTGDVCMGDAVLFRQRVYEKFSKMTRHGRVIGNRTVAGRVVKESYGAAKQQHTFTVEVLWSSGVRKLPPLSPLLVKGRNLYKQKTYRQRWKNEADRVKVLSEKHRRGAAARFVKAVKQKKKSCYANGSKGSKRQHEAQNTKRSKKGRSRDLNKVRHFDGSRGGNDYQSKGATSSTQETWNESASSRAFRSARGRVHNSTEFDRYQAPAYPLQASSRQIPDHYQVNSQSQNGSNEFAYHERGPVPNMREFPPFRPGVNEFTYHERGLVPNMRGFPPIRPGVNEFTYHERGSVPNMRGFPPFRTGVSGFTSRGNVSSYAHINRFR